MKNAFVIAATSSGSGKTTLSLGLMRHFSKIGISVKPFKCGPDYIDTQYHKLATGNYSINLDLFMSSEIHVRSLFDSYSNLHDISIVEGVMGLFDGYDGMKGSSAEVAVKLDLPVILLINASSTAYSVAATIFGFSRFNSNVRVAGVIFNKVASPTHYEFLQKACEDVGITALGYLSRNEKLQVPSRHLGLSLDSKDLIEKFIDEAAIEVAKHVKIEKLLSLTELKPREISITQHQNRNWKVAIAYDDAFNFVYPVNIDSLGVEVTYFSPLKDSVIPETDFIYLPGGYPELYAEQLEINVLMRTAIKEFAEKGGKILAECGGMIYLSEEIDGKKMCGVLPLITTMKDARLKLGYRKLIFPSLDIKGHEFHYSKTIPVSGCPTFASQLNAKDREVDTPVYRYKNVIATYTHLYWGETDILKLWE